MFQNILTNFLQPFYRTSLIQDFNFSGFPDLFQANFTFERWKGKSSIHYSNPDLFPFLLILAFRGSVVTIRVRVKIMAYGQN